MARTTGSNGARTMASIRRAAIKRIYQHGFEAMKLRDLAADVGIQAGSLYNYIEQKEEFLYSLLREIMEEVNAGLDQALDAIEDPVEALRRFVEFHLEWHTARREEVFIGNMELRSLTPAHYRAIVAMRSKYEARLRQILERGNRRKIWRVRNSKLTTYAIIAILTGVCTWYRPKGRIGRDELIRTYREIVFHTVGLAGH